MHGIDGTAGKPRGGHDEERRHGKAKAHFLAFHIALRGINAQGLNDRVARCFGPIDNTGSHDDEQEHGDEQGAALALIANHTPEHEGHGRRDDQHGENRKIVRPGGRIFKGMGGIGIEETAAIGAQLLDRFLAGNGSQGNSLLGTFQCCCIDRALKRLRHAKGYEGNGHHNGERQEHIERRLDEIVPEIANGCAELRAKARVKATARAMPVAAERKL